MDGEELNNGQPMPGEEGGKKITETQYKNWFKTYLEEHVSGVKKAYTNEDGVDVVALLKNGEKRYFELKTSSNKLREKKYFGAMSQVEWECAFAHPEHFYMVLMWNEGGKEVKDWDIHFKLYQYKELFDFTRLAPYTMYLNITLNAGDGAIKSQKIDDVFDLPRMETIKEQDENAAYNREMLTALGRYYNHLKIKKNIQKNIQDGKIKDPVLVLVPIDHFELGKTKILKTGEDVKILDFDSNAHSFDNSQEWEDEYYMVVAAPKGIVEQNGKEKGRMRSDLRLTRDNTWVQYYRLKKKE